METMARTRFVQKTSKLQLLGGGHLMLSAHPAEPVIMYTIPDTHNSSCLSNIYNSLNGVPMNLLALSSEKIADTFIDEYLEWMGDDECSTFFVYPQEEKLVIEKVTRHAIDGSPIRKIISFTDQAYQYFATRGDRFVFPAKSLVVRP